MIQTGARIAVGGLLHETNTFSPRRTTLQDFIEPDYWPGLKRGEQLISDLAGLNTSISGSMSAIQEAGHIVVPLTWASAPPGGVVTTAAFETIVGHLIDDLRASLPVDGVYLELHGALTTEELQDGDAEVLARVRAVVGHDVPVVASVDLHANVSKEMVAHADVLEAYRTYPHVDINDTGKRAAKQLLTLITGRGPRHKAFCRLDFLIPVPWQGTDIEPARSLYRSIPDTIGAGIESLSFAEGFNSADVWHAGPTVFGYGTQKLATDRAVQTLASEIDRHEPNFAGRLYSAAEAVDAAMALAERSSLPVIIADAEDNPGGGAPSDTTALLTELLRKGAKGVTVAMICDPHVARVAHAAGEGNSIPVMLGGSVDNKPLRGSFLVERLGSGTFLATGPMWGGTTMELGPMALLRIEGTRVIVSTKPFQAADQSIFRHLGVDPAAEKILVLKSSVHFRNDFQDISSEILVAETSGLLPIDPRKQPFKNLDPRMRLVPRGFATH